MQRPARTPPPPPPPFPLLPLPLQPLPPAVEDAEGLEEVLRAEVLQRGGHGRVPGQPGAVPQDDGQGRFLPLPSRLGAGGRRDGTAHGLGGQPRRLRPSAGLAGPGVGRGVLPEDPSREGMRVGTGAGGLLRRLGFPQRLSPSARGPPAACPLAVLRSVLWWCWSS